MTLTADNIAFATFLASILIAVLGYLYRSINALAKEMSLHKGDTVAHRTKAEEELWIRADDEFRREIRDRLQRIENKIDRGDHE